MYVTVYGHKMIACTTIANWKAYTYSICFLFPISYFSYQFEVNWITLVCLQKYGKIDVVVSNAAVNPSVDSILRTQESVLDKLWDINVKASVLLLQVLYWRTVFQNIVMIQGILELKNIWIWDGILFCLKFWFLCSSECLLNYCFLNFPF